MEHPQEKWKYLSTVAMEHGQENENIRVLLHNNDCNSGKIMHLCLQTKAPIDMNECLYSTSQIDKLCLAFPYLLCSWLCSLKWFVSIPCAVGKSSNTHISTSRSILKYFHLNRESDTVASWCWAQYLFSIL